MDMPTAQIRPYMLRREYLEVEFDIKQAKKEYQKTRNETIALLQVLLQFQNNITEYSESSSELELIINEFSELAAL